MMRKLVSQTILFATVAALAIAASGCNQYNGLKAKRTFRDANGLYQASDYKGASAKYEEVVALDEDTLARGEVYAGFDDWYEECIRAEYASLLGLDG